MQRIALFGEAEKGAFNTPHILRELPHLMDRLGNPPKESEGLFFAIQSILYNREIIFFRVEVEGFSPLDYYCGLKYLAQCKQPVDALCLPGVGDPEILEATQSLCQIYNSFLITNQKDLYDYLTSQ
jgi:hypothetical protein